MKKGISVLVFISIFVVGVVGGILGSKYFDKQKEENRVSEDNKVNDVGQNESENDKHKDNELDTPLTLERMISLANNENLKLKKDYGIETVLQLYNSERSMDLELKIDNGSLKITGNNKTWKVTDIEEKVIAIENELLYGCDISVMSSLFLTEKGNLYRLYRDERNSTMYNKVADGLSETKNSFFEQLDANEEIKIGLVKLNGSEKVQAIGTRRRCEKGSSCGGCETVVYMSNGEYRYVKEGLTEKYIEE